MSEPTKTVETKVETAVAQGDDVALHERPGGHVVEVDGAAAAGIHSLAEGVEEIVAEDGAPLAPVPRAGNYHYHCRNPKIGRNRYCILL